jgi:hypothetical protein
VPTLESIKNLFMDINYLKLHFGHKWLTHFGRASGFWRLCHAFFELFQDVAHINDLLFLGNARIALGILSSFVACQPSYFTWTKLFFSSFLSLLVGFNKTIMQVSGEIISPRSWESIQGSLMRHQTQLLISFGGIGLLSMEDCVQSIFLRSWVFFYFAFVFQVSHFR